MKRQQLLSTFKIGLGRVRYPGLGRRSRDCVALRPSNHWLPVRLRPRPALAALCIPHIPLASWEQDLFQTQREQLGSTVIDIREALVGVGDACFSGYKCSSPLAYSSYVSSSSGLLHYPRTRVATVNSETLTVSLGVLRTSPKVLCPGPT